MVINTTPVPFTDLLLQYAVPKVFLYANIQTMQLTMDTLSGNIVAPLNTSPVTQLLKIGNPTGDQKFKIRVKIGYSVNGARVDELGEYAEQ